jgi:YqjK-like protein
MRERLLFLAERRARLMARAQTERETIAALLKPADGVALAAISAFRAAQRALQASRRHPLIMVAGVALLVALRPRLAVTWIARGWSLWRLYRGAQGWWLRFSALTGTPAGTRK